MRYEFDIEDLNHEDKCKIFLSENNLNLINNLKNNEEIYYWEDYYDHYVIHKKDNKYFMYHSVDEHDCSLYKYELYEDLLNYLKNEWG